MFSHLVMTLSIWNVHLLSSLLSHKLINNQSKGMTEPMLVEEAETVIFYKCMETTLTN